MAHSGDIHMVVRWFHELPSASLLFEVFFDGSFGLVAHHIKCWPEALLFQLYEHLIECIDEDGVVL